MLRDGSSVNWYKRIGIITSNKEHLPIPIQYEFFKDKDIIIDYPIDLYTKLEDFTRNDEYLITDDRQDTIIWLLPDFYSYNFASSKLFEATNDYGFWYFSESVRPDMLRLFRSMHELFTAQKPFDQLGVSSKPIKSYMVIKK